MASKRRVYGWKIYVTSLCKGPSEINEPNLTEPTYELISDELIVQDDKANHGELRQIDLELEALIENWVVAVLGDGPGAALCAVGRNAVDLHVNVRVHHIPFGHRTPRLGKVLSADYLGRVTTWAVFRTSS